jgi:hypothetical protein
MLQSLCKCVHPQHILHIGRMIYHQKEGCHSLGHKYLQATEYCSYMEQVCLSEE